MKLFLLLFAIFFSTLACAEIYEVIDESGRKIYTDKPPLNDPNAKPVTVNPHTGNTWQSDSLQEENDLYFKEAEEKEQAENEVAEKEKAKTEEEKEKAADATADAEQELEDAKEIKAGDYLPNRNEGIHYTPEYLERVKEAEEKLEKTKEDSESESESESE